MLSEQERARYQRQILIPEWNEAGQEKLKASKVVVAGAGGLGSAVLTYLAAAGVGVLRIIDNDDVELSNLNRQVLHGDRNIGKRKVDSARERLGEINPDVRVEVMGEALTKDNVIDLVSDCPVVDALDNLPARLLLNQAALRGNLPLFHGAVHGFEGRATTIIPHKTACMSCLYKEAVPGKIPVAGVTPGIIGCIQATEVIKYILGTGELLCNRFLIYDGMTLRFSELRLKKDPNCPACAPDAQTSSQSPEQKQLKDRI